jgi:hypothetical protein
LHHDVVTDAEWRLYLGFAQFSFFTISPIVVKPKQERRMMEAIRKFADVISGSIKIDLPPDFQAKKVEIIILPIEESENSGQSLQELLLEAPTLSEAELQEYDDVRKSIDKWIVKEF